MANSTFKRYSTQAVTQQQSFDFLHQAQPDIYRLLYQLIISLHSGSLIRVILFLWVFQRVLPTLMMETAKAFTFTWISFRSHRNCPALFHPICATDLVNTTLAYVKNTPRISVYIFMQAGNFPHF